MVRVEAPQRPRVRENPQRETKPTKPKFELKPEQIFLSPGNFFLSTAGENIQAVIQFRQELKDPRNGISDARREKMKLDIDRLGRDSGVDISAVSAEDLESQFKRVVAERDEAIDGPLRRKKSTKKP